MSNLTPPAQPAQKRGFGLLPCPMCEDGGATMRLGLDDVNTFHCTECENEFTVNDVRSFIRAWEPVLEWIKTAPPRT